MKRNADNQLTEYKFSKSAVIKPGQQITVWSSNCGQTHEPPSDLVMNAQRWFVGDSMITILVDKEGNEQARRESQRVALSGVEKKLRSTPTRAAASSSTTVTTTTSETKVTSTGGSTSTVSKLFGLWKS